MALNKITKTSRIPFKVSARTAKLIGLENFSTEEGAIIELVKNTYDADANNCILIFDFKYTKQNNKAEDIFDKENSCIYIIDNGVGMNNEIIQNQWMTIGTDNKLYEHTSEGGRVKTGAKGIGRFALNRLGMFTNMSTIPDKIIDNKKDGDILIPNNKKLRYEWTVDWKDFDRLGSTVSDIQAILTEDDNFDFKADLLKRFESFSKVNSEIKKMNFDSGTLIEITELNDDWNEEKLLKLFGNLEMLLPPEEQEDFKLDFFFLNNLEEFGDVKRAYYDDYDYKLKASFNDQEKNIEIELNRNELDLSLLEQRYADVFEFEAMKKAPYRLDDFKKDKIKFEIPINNLLSEKVDKSLLDKIGKFDFTFYFLKNTISDDKDDGDLKKYPYKSINSANRKAWLKKFGGIKIFRDDFRIRPYGENGEDWLRLGERQAQSPGGAGQRLGGYRIRPNQIAGTIKISRIHNSSFQDKSGREGLIENSEFELFKNIIIDIISVFEKDRNTIMHNLYKLHSVRNEEAEKVRIAKEEAERIKKQKEEKDKSNQGYSEHGNKRNSKESQYTQSEENMADAIFILEKENEKKDEELRLLRSLASVGLIISSFAHEVRSLRARLIPRTQHLINELENHLDEKELSKNIDKDDNPFYMINLMREDDVKLKHWLDYSLSTLKIDKRGRRNLDFTKYFENFKANWSKALEQRSIYLELKQLDDNDHKIRAYEVDMDSIFNNLLSNSINAHYGHNTEQKKIEISWVRNDDDIEIIFSDNGKGLDKKYKNNPEEIFNLNESSKTDNKGNKIGTGLGLYIVKSIIEEYNGSQVSILNINGGVTFKITFKTRQ